VGLGPIGFALLGLIAGLHLRAWRGPFPRMGRFRAPEFRSGGVIALMGTTAQQQERQG